MKTGFSLAWIIVLLLVGSGCTHEQTISGQVVDESGTALSGAAVTACYSGWGWSNGQLVWDKDYCSAPVLTDAAGSYVINFSGPDAMRLRADKQGWVQTQDFHAAQSRVILTPQAAYRARSAAAAKEQEETFRDRLLGETAADYYCRVILSRVRSINLDYRDEKLAITPSLLTFAEREAYLALHGSPATAQAFCAEAQLRINGAPISGAFSLQPATPGCGADLQLVAVHLPDPVPARGDRIELLIPSLSAMFELQLWQQ